MSEKSEIRWVPLESNPQVMSKYMYKLGMSDKWQFTDVIGLDDDLLMMVPQPVVALVLLFPYSDKTKAFTETEEKKILEDGQTVSDELYYMKQTISNACGTIGVLHAVLNNSPTVSLESTLKEFLDETKAMTPEERGKKLESSETISQAHEVSAQEGQTEAPQADEDVCPHFIALVEKEGCVYELDGRKKFPINHGPVEESFLKSAANVCKKFMARDPSELRFTVLALAKND
ncbi:ubiquitin carboxyl-terminal hydrolase isozyme L3-like [Diadema antillarum]|uniref:ubiquitin carboxyl-terminal hydrolase isozyme L3-like n=1 Tax=Diadema antillarum TaxID=105358 RepID=UPI003A85DE2F